MWVRGSQEATKRNFELDATSHEAIVSDALGSPGRSTGSRRSRVERWPALLSDKFALYSAASASTSQFFHPSSIPLFMCLACSSRRDTSGLKKPSHVTWGYVHCRHEHASRRKYDSIRLINHRLRIVAKSWLAPAKLPGGQNGTLLLQPVSILGRDTAVLMISKRSYAFRLWSVAELWACGLHDHDSTTP